MPMQNPRDFLVYDLSTMHSMEQTILNMLPQMEQQCNNPQVKQAITDHIGATQRQVTRLQECFRYLGAQPLNVSCYAVECMQRDMQQFTQQGPSQDIIDMFCLGAADKTEHYEISAYQSAIRMCQAMGENQCVSLLQDTLQEEQSMCQRVEQIESRFGSQVVGRMAP